MTTYKKISALVLENAFTELQIRAYRVNELRNKQKLVNVSIVAITNKKKISVQVENLERLLDSFNNMMDTRKIIIELNGQQYQQKVTFSRK